MIIVVCIVGYHFDSLSPHVRLMKYFSISIMSQLNALQQCLDNLDTEASIDLNWNLPQ